MLAVTGYWDLQGKSRTSSNHNSYSSAFDRTTNFATDYIVFGERAIISAIQHARGVKPTYGVECSFAELVQVCEEAFACPNVLDRLTTTSLHRDDAEGRLHCPSSELLLVWLSKILWVRRSIDLHPEYTHYGWIDAGYKGLGPHMPPTQPWPATPAALEQVRGFYVKRANCACKRQYWPHTSAEGCPIGCMWFGDKSSVRQFIEHALGLIRARLQQGRTLCADQDVFQLACQRMDQVYSTQEGDNYRPFYVSDFPSPKKAGHKIT